MASSSCCTTVVSPAHCPSYAALLTLATCSNASLGALCEGSGECGTSNRENNCASWDVYWRRPCDVDWWPPPPPAAVTAPLPSTAVGEAGREVDTDPAPASALASMAPPALPPHPPPPLPPPHPPPRPPFSVPALPPEVPRSADVLEVFLSIVLAAFAIAAVVLAAVFKCLSR